MKRNILSLAALFILGSLSAQEDTRNAVVSVENDYNPTVVNVNKKDFTPTVEGKSNAKPEELIFSKQATPYTGFTSDRYAKDILPEQTRTLPGYLRAGYGIRNDVDAKIAYNLNFGKKSYLRILGTLDGFRSNVEEETGKWNSRMYNTAATVDFAYKFRKLTFNVDGDFNNRVLNYRRTNHVADASDRQHHMNYNIAMNGVSQLAGPFAYTFNAGYTHSTISYTGGAENPITEEHINASSKMSQEIYKRYLRRVGAELDFNGFIYNGTLRNATNGHKNLLSIDLNPFADFNFNNWEFTFGAKFNFRTGNGPIFAAAPDITVNKALTKRISFYSKATGGRKDNSFRTIEGITPYWGYNTLTGKQIKPTYRIIDFVAGTRITLEPLSLDISAGYVLTKDDLLQTASEDTFSGLVYSNLAQELTNNIHAGCRIGYDYGGWLNVEADARYDYWTCKEKDYLMLRPEITANATIEVYPIKNLAIKVGYNFTRYTKGTQERVSDKHDLHARVSYTINNYVGAFIQGDNLLNDRYYEYAGYYTRGIRGMLGAYVSF